MTGEATVWVQETFSVANQLDGRYINPFTFNQQYTTDQWKAGGNELHLPNFVSFPTDGDYIVGFVLSIQLSANNGGSADFSNTAALSLNIGDSNIIHVNDGGALNVNYANQLSATPTPEPATYCMAIFAAALYSVGLIRRASVNRT
jgi:hypothetical protein